MYSAVSNVIPRVTKAFGILRNWLKGIAARLWNLLCNLATPKEWKIKGSVGSGPFNLANVEIEISFGKGGP